MHVEVVMVCWCYVWRRGKVVSCWHCCRYSSGFIHTPRTCTLYTGSLYSNFNLIMSQSVNHEIFFHKFFDFRCVKVAVLFRDG